MKKFKLFFVIISFLLQLTAFAQVQVDHPIRLTGSGANAKIMGIQNVSNLQDATSAQVVQSNSLIYATATGNGNNFILNITPAIGAYDTGMMFTFISNQSINGQATLNVDNLGAIAIKKNINQSIGQCDIQTGQVVLVIYDGANFQMLSASVAAVPTVASAGPSQIVNGTSTSLAANTPIVGTGLWTIVSGTGGSLSNAGSPTSAFTGIAGNTYILSWTISNCTSLSSSSSDTISFSPNPSAISGLWLWYDANDASTFTYSSGNSVSIWADKSVNGYNASNSNTSEQPVLIANDINGRSAVRFTSSSYTYLMNSVFTMNLANRSVFIVAQNTDANSCSAGIISVRGSGNDYQSNDGYIIQNYQSTTDVLVTNLYPNYSIDLTTSSSVQCDIPLGIYTDIATSGAGTAYVNGVPGGTGNNPNSATSQGGIVLGARYFNGGTPYLGEWQWDGDIAEVIIYNRALSTTERDEVGAYLSGKWGISFTP